MQELRRSTSREQVEALTLHALRFVKERVSSVHAERIKKLEGDNSILLQAYLNRSKKMQKTAEELEASKQHAQDLTEQLKNEREKNNQLN